MIVVAKRSAANEKASIELVIIKPRKIFFMCLLMRH